MAAAEPAFTTQGWLLKRGHFVKNWKRRWFILVGHTLYYYINETKETPGQPMKNFKGSIPLKACFVTNTLASVFRKDFCFNVQTASGKDYYLVATSNEERESWSATLRAVRDDTFPQPGLQSTGSVSSPAAAKPDAPVRSATEGSMPLPPLTTPPDPAAERYEPVSLNVYGAPGGGEQPVVESKPCSLLDFNLLHVIGRGSFAKVMQVQKKDTGKLYAMKVLEKSKIQKKKQIEHTRAEKDLLVQVNHPFIVKLHFAFQSEDKLYMVLDYVNGGEMFHHHQQAGRFNEARSRLYAMEVLLAIGHLHTLGFIYRDLKPENILLDNEGHVKLTDFGLVKSLGGANTYTFCGTPDYLAPEILRNTGHGRPVDWWCLGVLLFEMLTGKVPFIGKSSKEVYEKILSQEPVYPSYLAADAVNVISLLMRKDASKRLGSGTEDYLEICRHPFFANTLNYQAVLNREVRPEFVPPVTSAADVSQIDPAFTKMRVSTPDRLFIRQKNTTGDFAGFSYVTPTLASRDSTAVIGFTPEDYEEINEAEDELAGTPKPPAAMTLPNGETPLTLVDEPRATVEYTQPAGTTTAAPTPPARKDSLVGEKPPISAAASGTPSPDTPARRDSNAPPPAAASPTAGAGAQGLELPPRRKGSVVPPNQGETSNGAGPATADAGASTLAMPTAQATGAATGGSSVPRPESEGAAPPLPARRHGASVSNKQPEPQKAAEGAASVPS